MGPKEGRGPQTDKYLPQSPFTCQFFQMTTFCFGIYMVISPWFHALAYTTECTMWIRVILLEKEIIKQIKSFQGTKSQDFFCVFSDPDYKSDAAVKFFSNRYY
jgi:hypothetical protein